MTPNQPLRIRTERCCFMLIFFHLNQILFSVASKTAINMMWESKNDCWYIPDEDLSVKHGRRDQESSSCPLRIHGEARWLLPGNPLLTSGIYLRTESKCSRFTTRLCFSEYFCNGYVTCVNNYWVKILCTTTASIAVALYKLNLPARGVGVAKMVGGWGMVFIVPGDARQRKPASLIPSSLLSYSSVCNSLIMYSIL